ncbi:MAG: J domain-containing protein [Nitriliruptoraceae bacterium]
MPIAEEVTPTSPRSAPSEPPAWPTDVDQARQVLGVTPDAPATEIRHRWRVCARRHHPDRGGDVATFLALREAYRLLAAAPSEAETDDPPTIVRGRPSRPRPDEPIPLATIDWHRRPSRPGEPLDCNSLAVIVGEAGLGRMSAVSRAPASRLNRWAAQVAGDTAARLIVAPQRDDRQHLVTEATIAARSRVARRTLETARLPGDWLRRRLPSVTTVTFSASLSTTGLQPGSSAHPTGDQGRAATLIASAVDSLLTSMGWHLDQWLRTAWTADNSNPPLDGSMHGTVPVNNPSGRPVD